MAKTATFGMMHVATSFCVTYAITGSFAVAGVVTFVEPLVNTVMHYFFDAYWDHPRVEAFRCSVASTFQIPGRTVPPATPDTAQG